jgi:predicted DNA-binding protein
MKKRINFFLPDSMYEQLRDESFRQRTTMAVIIRRAIEMYFFEQEKKKKK